ncbi:MULTISPECIES: azurin [unclassified Variovorax]|uniref:azurin n=1 Tax=unclassified Variovorax TaxID=663243 RepID=UPI0025789312|nr:MULTISPECIES: azurin [unclassified Variovorax]MDM0087048.1 azurin [Variovorax sp. J22G40]MDM0144695.1 azurin [Variovorax sp. J2P1-31]
MLASRFALALLALAAAPAFAADCTVEIEGNDAMQFNKPVIEVSRSCKEFTVKLKHSGKLPKQAMGHNWVLSRTADVQAVATDGIAAGAAQNYVKAGDARVLAHTRIVGGGESDSASFAVAKLDAAGSYSYFCSFPGHSALMKGTLKLVK